MKISDHVKFHMRGTPNWVICIGDEMARTKHLDMGTYYFIEVKYQKLLILPLETFNIL